MNFCIQTMLIVGYERQKNIAPRVSAVNRIGADPLESEKAINYPVSIDDHQGGGVISLKLQISI